MPDLSSVLTNLRTDGYHYRGYLSVPTETVIFRALVNQTTFTYPLTSITFDTVTVGAFGDILEDQEVVIYNQSTNTVKGRLRVASGAATSTVLQVNEFSQGRLSIANNDKIEVLRSYRVRDKIVGATSSFPKDSRLAYSDQGANPAPIANAGGPYAGFTSSSVVTVSFDATTSFNVDPDSSTTRAYLWDVADGTITVGSTTTGTITATFPAGFRWVNLRVTDSSNSKQTFKRIPVWAHDWTSNPPLECNIDSMGAQVNDGWRVRLTIPAGASQSTIADGSLVVYWEQEYYAGSLASYGNNVSGRSHIKAVGYVIGETITQDAESGTLSFEAINPLAMLSQIPGFSQVLQIRSSPTNWRGVKGLTTNRALIYLLRWGSTFLNVHDLILNAVNHNYPAFYVQKNTPADQLREIVDGVDGLLICDRTGRLVIDQDLALGSSAQRSAATTTAALTDADIIDIEWERSHRYEYNTIEGRGFIASSTVKGAKPLLSLAPGKAPAEAPQSSTVERLIAASQSDLNSRTGRRWAKQNRLYNGLPVSRIRVTLPASYDVFDLYGEWITLTLASTYNKRGLSYSATRCLIESISIEHDPETGNKSVRLTLLEETDGAAGVTKRPPSPALNNLPAFTLPEIEMPYYLPVAPADNPAYTGRMALIRDDKNILTTPDWWTPEAAGGPTWTANSISASVSGTMLCFGKNYFSPLLKTGSGSMDGWIVTTSNIYKIADIGGARTITNQHTFATTTVQRSIITSRAVEGWAVVASNIRGSGGTIIHWTTDGGTTWNGPATVSSFYNTATGGVLDGDGAPPAVALGDHPSTLGNVYVVAYTATGSGTAATTGLYLVPSYGAGTPVLQTTMSGSSVVPGVLLFPYQNNPADSIFHWTKTTGTSSTAMTYARTTGTTQETINPTGSGTVVGGNLGENGFVRSIDACPTDRNYLAAIFGRVSGASFASGLYTTADGGTTWTERVAPNTTTRWENVWYDDLDKNTIFLLSSSLGIGVSFDQGATIDNRTGNASLSVDYIGIVGY